MSGLHWSTERHARTPQASVLFALIFARGASIFCSKRAACLSCASPSSAHRSQPCSCPCIGSCTSRHHTCGVNAWPWPGARTSAAAKGERHRASQIQIYSTERRRELYRLHDWPPRRARGRGARARACEVFPESLLRCAGGPPLSPVPRLHLGWLLAFRFSNLIYNKVISPPPHTTARWSARFSFRFLKNPLRNLRDARWRVSAATSATVIPEKAWVSRRFSAATRATQHKWEGQPKRQAQPKPRVAVKWTPAQVPTACM